MCKKSIYDPNEFEKELDEYMESVPMPKDFKDVKAQIICNECCQESSIPYHVAGGKCPTCGSYNTTKTKNNEYDHVVDAFKK